MDQDGYKKLISGQQKGLGASISRGLLRGFSVLYSAAVAYRNRAYSSGKCKITKVSKPVISIGNITAGGTGKTPLVIWICNFLQDRDLNCAILTRGYKTQKGKFSDEPAVITKNCPSARILVNSDRVASAKLAIEKYNARVLIMDDGFQHRRLHRDLNIVTIDAICPFGYDKLLPAGLLREPLDQLQRADAIIITRCDLAAPETLTRIEEKIRQFNPDAPIARTAHCPVQARGIEDSKFNLNALKGKKVFAFCGIGNPQAFFALLKSLGMKIVRSKVFNDHHNYIKSDLADIYEEARYLKADLIITTEKDWTKTSLLPQIEDDVPFAFLQIELKFISGQEKITQLIESTLAGTIES